MKIATWNVDRLRTKKNRDEIIKQCNECNADILVLTENDDTITPKYQLPYTTQTPPPLNIEGYDEPLTYRSTEHRVSIYTNYKKIKEYETFDPHTSICIELETEKGNLLVYGTIIGVLGNRHPSFKKDLIKQMADIRKLADAGHNICICGDYNCSFSDNYYYTKEGRELIKNTFSECDIKLLTEECSSCIDHIAISNKFICESSEPVEWNMDKRLSDHKGVSVEFN